MVKRDIIVIGASAGGLQALSALLSKLPKHSKHRYLSSGTFRRTTVRSSLRVLSRAGKLPATHAVDGEPIRPGRI